MKPRADSFSLPSRLLHWLMAPLLLAMLLIGVGMISTVSHWRLWLIGIHKPLGLALLVLVVLRLLLRLLGHSPKLPSSMPAWQRHVATLSHWLLYGAMFAMPLLGWGMLSAAGYPLPGIGAFHLPSIAPQNVTLYAWLRYAHGVCGQAFFALIVFHIAAGLLHALVLKDGVFKSISLRAKSGHR
ncbi:cytochrome b [Glaciimonas sp. PAMC28666]|uniref:cytochrome b n=1 Tax=Glaciimonas sp. PAMC28666 TaxID=2807626 RepID=UPI0019649CE3|nr:cytochrome b/b6 domain-containing protein [Glaciimonas sp. PAMC28666]QRX82090.1 cytochrome b/b6 domain-containing protein [Glaciimonas sp. PAMC28666]